MTTAATQDSHPDCRAPLTQIVALQPTTMAWEAPNLKAAIAKLIGTENHSSEILRLSLSVEQDFSGDDYAAVLYVLKNSQSYPISFASKYATGLLVPGAEKGYLHEKMRKAASVQRSLSPQFFRDLSREVEISRHLDRPLKTDWREYETEEEKADFHQRLGARRSSVFMNLRVETQVMWPKEPTRIRFGGHHLVLFPKTLEHSHSVSIDLAHERLSADDARSLINRMLSIMSWCDNQPASLHEGWSGNPVPVPVPRLDMAFSTMPEWHFYRDIPGNEKLLQCLAYYRDGLNAYFVGLASHAVLSFFRVFETQYDKKAKVKKSGLIHLIVK